MTKNLTLKCHCGALRGIATDVSPRTGSHIVCMCDDCQIAAHYFGCGDRVLDRNGGTDVFQLTPSQIRFTSGKEHLRCMRLSPKGLMRWYAGCCNTPMANSLAFPRVAFAGIVCAAIEQAADGSTLDDALGPILARVQGRYGRGELPEGTHAKAPIGLIFRALRFVIGDSIRGRQKPSPFFDSDSGEWVVVPMVIDPAERERLRQLC